VDRIATARNIDAVRNSACAKVVTKDFVKLKDDLLTKAIAKNHEHCGSAS